MSKIKETISTKALAYFDVPWLTEVYVDASPKGLGAVCLQINPYDNRDRRVITFFSRKLSELESWYSQVEKKALAVVLACKRLSLYLIGSRFRQVTDNREVQILFSNNKTKSLVRIE